MVYIVVAKRTAIGKFGGSLATLDAHHLGEVVIKDIIQHSGIDSKEISEVIMGQVLTAGQGQNPARQAALNAKIDHTVPALTINQVCGSGLRAVALAAQSIICGNSNMVIAGGQENMTRSHHSALIRSGVKMGSAEFVDTMMVDGLSDAFYKYAMGVTAENIAKQYNISRQEQDEYALTSQKKAAEAQKNGKFTDEIVPVIVKNRKEEIIFNKDEFIKLNMTIDSLARLRPAFDKEGSVTAGNSSGINDGAAALLIVNEAMLKRYNLEPLARIVSFAHAGVEPGIMGVGPVPAVNQALIKAGWQIADLDLIEANEAFAAQAIGISRKLKWDFAKVNVNGGAIAIGHPIGASGARVIVTLLHEMKKRKSCKGLATLCIGGGMGVAMCFER